MTYEPALLLQIGGLFGLIAGLACALTPIEVPTLVTVTSVAMLVFGTVLHPLMERES